MGFQDRGDGGTAPYEPGLMGEMDLLRRKAAQAGQLTSLGAEPGMAQRWSGVPEGPPISTPEQINRHFDLWEAEGRAAQPGKLFSNPGVEEERRALDLDAEVEAEAARHRPSYQQQLQGIETLDVPGRDIGLGMAAPVAPSGIGARPPASTLGDPQAGSLSEFRARIEAQRAIADRLRPRSSADADNGTVDRIYGTNLDRDPMFSDVQSGAPQNLNTAGTLQQEPESATGERRWTLKPHGEYGGGTASDFGADTPAQHESAMAGLASRAFKPQTFDPAEMDVSQATLEHAMAQRAAQAQLSGMESQARQQSAQADAAERDPLGIERYRAQQAIQDARFAAQNQGRRDVSLADDQFRAEQQNTRANRVNEIINSHLESKRALEAALAQAAPDSPEAAMRQQQLDSLREETEMTLAGLGVRLPNTGI